SLMTTKLKGKSPAEAMEMFRVFHDLVTGETDDAPRMLGDLRLMQGVRNFPQRVKCAMLAWRAIEQALQQSAGESTISTETDFSVLDGNDLVTPHPEWGFPGLEPGDKWCVCVTRWKDALEHDVAAPIDLEATHSSALEFVTLEELKAHALK